MKTLLSGELRVKVKAGTVVKFCDTKGVTVTPVMELTAAIVRASVGAIAIVTAVAELAVDRCEAV